MVRQMSGGGIEPKAFFKSYHTKYSALLLRREASRAMAARKLCSLQPFIARNPFWAGVKRSLASSHVEKRRARKLAYSLHSGRQFDGTDRGPFL
ncbi:Hypothetical protein PHPALM_19594 [Phytophthora palmivora]|uniref:Uncharacterized protein n=1 Tax=Phytophthora palmivora TaxID=4796 RepID=A0A2P4XGZ1_9STRA|nr:Hypothetical protein PHPALM_19594 [Phytophthora palmivora]